MRARKLSCRDTRRHRKAEDRGRFNFTACNPRLTSDGGPESSDPEDEVKRDRHLYHAAVARHELRLRYAEISAQAPPPALGWDSRNRSDRRNKRRLWVA